MRSVVAGELRTQREAVAFILHFAAGKGHDIAHIVDAIRSHAVDYESLLIQVVAQRAVAEWIASVDIHSPSCWKVLLLDVSQLRRPLAFVPLLPSGCQQQHECSVSDLSSDGR